MIMSKNKMINKILKINSHYDISFLKKCSEEFLHNLLIDNMIVSQGYGNASYLYFN